MRAVNLISALQRAVNLISVFVGMSRFHGRQGHQEDAPRGSLGTIERAVMRVRSSQEVWRKCEIATLWNSWLWTASQEHLEGVRSPLWTFIGDLRLEKVGEGWRRLEQVGEG